MKKLLALAAVVLLPHVTSAQQSDLADTLKPPAKFFRTEKPLTVTMITNVKQLRRDKDEKSPWRAATFMYLTDDSTRAEVPAKIKTNGIWRLHHCDFPPLRVNLTKEARKNTPFEGFSKGKVTSYCKDTDSYEEYVLAEFQLYRIYQLLSPYGHMVRLAHVTYQDSASGKMHAIRYAFFIEDPDAMAERATGKILKQKGAAPRDLDDYMDALFGLFEYMIGNTDWSISALHNVELLALASGKLLPVPRDYDYAGAVGTPYATPDPKLPIASVKQRLYRGYCADEGEFMKAVALFNAKKDAIYALYNDDVGKLLSRRIADNTLSYFDDFYKTINDRGRLKRDIIEQCFQPGN